MQEMTYNEIIQKAGKRILKHVYYVINNNTTYVDDANVKSVKFTFGTSLVGTIMQGCELVLKEPINGNIYVNIEAKYGEYTATKLYGPFTLKEEPTYNASDKTYTHYLYDNILLSMKDYQPITMVYPTTIYAFFSQLVQELGYTTNIASLPNGSIQMASDIYNGINYTYRDVLDDIAQANGVLFYIDGMELKIASLGTTPITINDKILKKQNIAFGEHFGPINVITLSRAGGSDNIYYPATLPATVHEFKISDNQLMNDNNRDAFLPAIYSQLNGIEYDIFDTELVGYGDIIPLQQVEFTTGGNTYSSYVFNQETLFTTGYKQSIYTELPEETTTDYKYADTTDKRINQTQIIVDKQNGIIQSLVSKVVDISDTVTGFGSVTLENALIGPLHYLSIKGQISLDFPSNTVYPDTDVYPVGSELSIDGTLYNLDFDYLNYLNNTTYDEFVYEDGRCYIIRRVGVVSDSMYALPEETIEERSPIILNVNADSTISLVSFANAILTCNYLLNNEYTTTFANKAEVHSEIEQTADSINLEVATKVDNEDYTGANILLKINQDESEAKIKADKVNLTGYVTVSDLSGTGTTTINGSNITTGTITTSVLDSNVITTSNLSTQNISANQISSGTINASSINVTNLTADNITRGSLSGIPYTFESTSDGTVNLGNNSDGPIMGYRGTSKRWSIASFTTGGRFQTFDSSGNMGAYLNQAGASAVISDKNDKTNIKSIDIDKSIDIITELKPVTFSFINNIDEKDRYHRGLIAQEVEKTMLDLGLKNQVYEINKDGRYLLNYIELIPDLINCIKYLKAKIETLEKESK